MRSIIGDFRDTKAYEEEKRAGMKHVDLMEHTKFLGISIKHFQLSSSKRQKYPKED